ncbi:MAG: nucleoside-diphosphate kinase [Deltaproteobacteria bacterium]|nr:nucleoside-diphosphate kinase [Deltaproteobacteria bacterium]
MRRNLIGKIIGRYEEEGFRIAAMKMKKLSREEAEGFYAEHRGKSFFDELTAFLSSTPVVLMALKGENAVKRNRDIMGATNPAQAADGTIRRTYAKSIGENTIHGSDSVVSAERELGYFFSKTEIYS